MDYVILDLEWNTAYSKSAHKFVNEIIEFGAVKVIRIWAIWNFARIF